MEHSQQFPQECVHLPSKARWLCLGQESSPFLLGGLEEFKQLAALSLGQELTGPCLVICSNPRFWSVQERTVSLLVMESKA